MAAANQGRSINGAGVPWPCRLVTPLTGLQRAMESESSNAEVQLVHAQGCAIDGTGQNGGIDQRCRTAASADAAVLPGCKKAIKTSRSWKAFDRVELGLPGNQLALVRAVLAVQPRTVLVIISAVAVSEPSKWPARAQHPP